MSQLQITDSLECYSLSLPESSCNKQKPMTNRHLFRLLSLVWKRTALCTVYWNLPNYHFHDQAARKHYHTQIKIVKNVYFICILWYTWLKNVLSPFPPHGMFLNGHCNLTLWCTFWLLCYIEILLYIIWLNKYCCISVYCALYELNLSSLIFLS
jgi:hypothetical protein